MKTPPICIEVDTRETLPWTFGTDVTTETATLKHGDYRAKNHPECVIERKSLPDFVMCVASAERPRFQRELRALGSPAYKFAAVVIEATPEDVFATAYRSMATPQSVWASALAIPITYGVHVFWGVDRATASSTALWLLRRWVDRERNRQVNVPLRFAMRRNAVDGRRLGR